jgi:hypothetical protein
MYSLIVACAALACGTLQEAHALQADGDHGEDHCGGAAGHGVQSRRVQRQHRADTDLPGDLHAVTAASCGGCNGGGQPPQQPRVAADHAPRLRARSTCGAAGAVSVQPNLRPTTPNPLFTVLAKGGTNCSPIHRCLWSEIAREPTASPSQQLQIGCRSSHSLRGR